MTESDKRLDRLLPGLSVRERALLMLRDFKADKPQDDRLLNSAPDGQTTELNRLIGLMNAANGDLAHLIVILRERVQKEGLRFRWLESAHRCALEMWAVRAHFNISGSEPITETEYREREAQARAALMKVDACATILTEEHHIWDDADYENDENGVRSLTDEAWHRVHHQKVKELAALVAAGALGGSGKGKRLKIACGSFYDWLNAPAPVVPDFGSDFDVRPDDRTEQVARARRDHDFIQSLLDRGACKVDLPLDMESPLVIEPDEERFGVDLARILAVRVRSGVQGNWRELRAVEAQVESITQAFDGEDVLVERTRAYLDEAQSMLGELHEQVQKYTGPFELPDPDDELRAMVQQVVDNEVQHLRDHSWRRLGAVSTSSGVEVR